MNRLGTKVKVGVAQVALVAGTLVGAQALNASGALAAPECFGRTANVVGTSGADVITIDEGPGNTLLATVNGVTKTITGPVVIAALGGNDEVDVNLNRDVAVFACLGGGNDTFNSTDSNKAPATVNGSGGADVIHGGGGDDRLLGGTGQDEIHGESGFDTCRSPSPAQGATGCEA